MDYKDEDALRRECEEGRRLGFDGKVCSFMVIPSMNYADQYSKRYILPRSILSIQHTLPPKLLCIKLPESKSHLR